MEEQLRNLTMSKALVIAAILTVVYYSGAYNDGTVLEGQIAAMQAELSKNQTEVAAIQKAVQDAERYEKTMASLGKEMEMVMRAIPKDITSVELMKLISNEAKVVGVEISNLATSSQNAAGSANASASTIYTPVGVDLSIRGSYNQVMLFLSNLTKLDKIINTSSMTLAGQTSGSGSVQTPTIDLKVIVEAYRYIPPVAADGSAQKPNSANGDPDA